MKKNLLEDQSARERFSREIDRNFSVIAPAGVGKTTAIVSRIVRMTLEDANRRVPYVPKLIVVTYTRKAAQEMQERSRRQIMQLAENSPLILSHFNQAFFGTIHSFCLKLLRLYGPMAGLPSNLILITDDTALWNTFLRSTDQFLGCLPESIRTAYARHINLWRVLALARHYRFPTIAPKKLHETIPSLDFSYLFQFEPTKRTEDSVREAKERLQKWIADFKAKSPSLPLPECTKGGRLFQEQWKDVFSPLRSWLATITGYFVHQVAEQYRQFRLQKGYLTYEDMVSMVTLLLTHPVVGDQIRLMGYRILLDEAQDTDYDQFLVLLATAQSPLGKQVDDLPIPEPGRFCMIGDPQQAIFSSRADLPTYLKIHQLLTKGEHCEPLTFHVTMRCDKAIVKGANTVFPKILTGAEQVNFVPLKTRPSAGEGQLIRLPLSHPHNDSEKLSSAVALRLEAEALARWLKEQHQENWKNVPSEQIAFLCPRKNWLHTLAYALRAEGFTCQMHSHDHVRGDSPTFAWVTALLTVMAQPDNAFELVGVLREIFGLSDHDIATYAQRYKGAEHPLTLLTPPKGNGVIADQLRQLKTLREQITSLPLRDQVSQVIRATELRERLELLPPDAYPEDCSTALENLLVQATLAEKEGLSLSDWVMQLQELYFQSAEEEPVKTGHLQLYSCHKAKGLEWPIVILPFLFSPIRFSISTYPQLIYPGEGQPPSIIFDKHHPASELRELQQQQRIGELERLLYVASTRARKTLILVDGTDFSPPLGNRDSFAEILKILPGEEHRDLWEELPIHCTKEEFSVGKKSVAVTVAVAKNVDAAIEKAKVFKRKIVPSSLKKEKTSTEVGGSADYGIWWHAVMEGMPWGKGLNGWTTHLEEAWKECPDGKRGKHEVALFLKTDFAKWLRSKSVTARSEVPFLWGKDKESFVEGYIDLVVESEGEWTVVDWKTDRVPVKTLVEAYRDQVKAYVGAVLGIFGGTVKGYLYSTVEGELIYVE